jgi:DivIVA domain-containing protein
MDEAGGSREQSAPDPADLSPDVIRTLGLSLSRSVRGYDADEVDALLSRLADRIAELDAHNVTLSERVNQLAKKVFFHEGRAWAVQEALVTAQTLRSDTQDEASAEADKIRQQAAREASKLLSAARQEYARLEEVGAALRSATEANAKAAREGADAYAESTRREVDEYAASTRREVDEYAEATRLSADEYGTNVRADAEAYGEATRANADTVRQIADDYAEGVRNSADEYGEGARDSADQYASVTRATALSEAEAKLEESEQTIAQVRTEATAEAASVLERAESWAEVEKSKLESQLDAMREEALVKSKEGRDAIAREARMLRDRAKRDTDKQRSRARAVLGQAEADARLIREEVKREVEELRARAEREAESLRALASDDATRIRELAEDAASELEESTRLELLRISTKIQIQIEERHRILERLDKRRSGMLAHMHALLVKELDVVEQERAWALADEARAAEDDHGAVVIGMSLDSAETAEGKAPALLPGVTAGWSSVIDPGTGQVKDAGHGVTLGLGPGEGSLDTTANGAPADGLPDAVPPTPSEESAEGGDEAVP